MDDNTDSAGADLPTFLTTRDLARVTRSTESSVRNWRYTGTGPVGVRIGKRVLYRREDVLAWLDRLTDAGRDGAA
jgi:hypothetical protein